MFLASQEPTGLIPDRAAIPAFAISGYTTLGNSDNPRPNTYADQSFTINNNVGFTTGRHDLRFGPDVVGHQLNHWQPELNNPTRGVYIQRRRNGFKRQGQLLQTSSTGMPLSCGTPVNVGKSLQYLTMSGREWQFGTHIRHRWQATQI